MQGLLIACAGFAVVWLWSGVFAPLLARAFGVPAQTSFWSFNRRNQHLSYSQYVWWDGVVGWGFGMLACSLVWSQSSLFYVTPGLSLRKLVIWLFVWPLAGLLGGLATWRPTNESR
jgi:hypothetical protein